MGDNGRQWEHLETGFVGVRGINKGLTFRSTAETYQNCMKQIQSLWVIIITSLSRHFLDHGKSPMMLDMGLLEPASTAHLL
jgi:hypothetical protein